MNVACVAGARKGKGEGQSGARGEQGRGLDSPSPFPATPCAAPSSAKDDRLLFILGVIVR